MVRTGTFDVVAGEPDSVEHEGERARIVDVAAAYARVQRTHAITGR
jgi:hypothetical protein